MATAPQPRITPEDYLEFERSSDVRHEFDRGKLCAVSGASFRHGLISANLMRELGVRLQGQPCAAISSDLRVCVHPNGLYAYPDVLVVCGPPQFLDGQFDTLLNPSLIIEILSDSTERYDRGEKFAQYQRIESLRAYVLVSQALMRVEWFTRRDDETWTYQTANAPDGVLDLPDALSLPISIPLSAIYDRVEFDPSRP